MLPLRTSAPNYFQPPAPASSSASMYKSKILSHWHKEALQIGARSGDICFTRLSASCNQTMFLNPPTRIQNLPKKLRHDETVRNSTERVLGWLVNTLRHHISFGALLCLNVLFSLTKFLQGLRCAPHLCWVQLMGILRRIATALPSGGALFGNL